MSSADKQALPGKAAKLTYPTAFSTAETGRALALLTEEKTAAAGFLLSKSKNDYPRVGVSLKSQRESLGRGLSLIQTSCRCGRIFIPDS